MVTRVALEEKAPFGHKEALWSHFGIMLFVSLSFAHSPANEWKRTCLCKPSSRCSDQCDPCFLKGHVLYQTNVFFTCGTFVAQQRIFSISCGLESICLRGDEMSWIDHVCVFTGDNFWCLWQVAWQQRRDHWPLFRLTFRQLLCWLLTTHSTTLQGVKNLILQLLRPRNRSCICSNGDGWPSVADGLVTRTLKSLFS